MKLALRAVVRHVPVLRALAAATALFHVTWGIFGAIWILYVARDLGLSPVAVGVIAGLGIQGYLLALQALSLRLKR